MVWPGALGEEVIMGTVVVFIIVFAAFAILATSSRDLIFRERKKSSSALTAERIAWSLGKIVIVILGVVLFISNVGGELGWFQL
jgi:ABC-type nickel/cobalt efflux system permease component RcnA